MFDLTAEKIIKEFEFWVIIENRFPYDNMADTNHLLISKKPLETLSEASEATRKEYEEVVESVAKEGFYDARIENFPKVTTVKSQHHIHLVKWHNTPNK